MLLGGRACCWARRDGVQRDPIKTMEPCRSHYSVVSIVESTRRWRSAALSRSQTGPWFLFPSQCGRASTFGHYPTQDTPGVTHRVQDDSGSCHAACIHWRQGILDQAKELNWCMHELERVNTGELETVTILEFDRMFKPLLQSTCTTCHPMPMIR